MDLGATDRQRSYPSPTAASTPTAHHHSAHAQAGLFFWPWATSYSHPHATGGSGTGGAGPTPGDIESLYRFGYPHPSAAAVAAAAAAVNSTHHGAPCTTSPPPPPPPDQAAHIGLHANNYHQGHLGSQGQLHGSSHLGQQHQQQQSGGGQLGHQYSPNAPHMTPNVTGSGVNIGIPTLQPDSTSSLPTGMEMGARMADLSPVGGLRGDHLSRLGLHPSFHTSAGLLEGPAPTKGYKCKICQQLCFSRNDLTKHNTSVHKQDPRPYRCEHCGRQFSTSAYLSQHRRIHLGVKPYSCRFCDRRFTQLSHVQQHERIHTGHKPYKCCTCFKAFTQMSNLQSHQRQHMKGKPCRCENCFMCFDTQDELDTHVQAKHAAHKYSKILVCPICSKNYNSETYLNKHLQKHKDSSISSDHQPPPAHQGGLKMKSEAGSLSPLHHGTGHHPLLGHTQSSLLSPGGIPLSHSTNALDKERVLRGNDLFFNNNNNNNNHCKSTNNGGHNTSNTTGLGNGNLSSSHMGSVAHTTTQRMSLPDRMTTFGPPSRTSSVEPPPSFCSQYGHAGNQRLPSGFNPAAVAYSALMDHHHHTANMHRDATPYDMIPSFTFPNFRF